MLAWNETAPEAIVTLAGLAFADGYVYFVSVQATDRVGLGAAAISGRLVADDTPPLIPVPAVLVSNATMFEGDRGSVVVGGRVELGDLDSEDEDPLDEELAHEDMMLGHRGGRRVAPDDLADANEAGRRGKGKGVGVDRSRHFNYYAFDGATGSTRWRHESEDFHRDLDGLADRLTPQHNYRLTAQASNGPQETPAAAEAPAPKDSAKGDKGAAANGSAAKAPVLQLLEPRCSQCKWVA